MAQRTISRRTFLKTGLVAGGAAAAGAGAFGMLRDAVSPNLPRNRSRKPNVLILLADALRADYVGCYGARRKNHLREYVSPTPNMDKLAEEGTFCSNAYAHSVTTHSMFSLHSGRPISAFDPLYEGRQSCYFPTFPELFKQHGYDTKTLSCNPYHFAFSWNTRGYQTDDIYIPERSYHWRVEAAIWEFERMIERITEPFLWYIHILPPHMPYNPSRLFFNYFDDGHRWDEEQQVLFGETSGFGRADRIIDHVAELTPKDLEHIKALYAANVYSADWFVGQVLEQLSRYKVLDRTVIVFLSDHGDEFLDHGGFFHDGTMYEEDTRIPLIIRYPDQVLRNRRLDDLVGIADVPATVLDLADIQDTLGEGRSLRTPLCETTASPHRQRAFSECQGVAIREGPWKFIIYDWQVSNREGQKRWRRNKGDMPTELYDLSKDPAEKTDLADRHPQLVERFTGLAQEHVEQGAEAWMAHVPARGGPESPRDVPRFDFKALDGLVAAAANVPQDKKQDLGYRGVGIRDCLEIDKKLAQGEGVPPQLVERLRAIGYLR